MSKKDKILIGITLALVIFTFISYFAFLQFSSKSFFGIDDYYHVAVADFIKDFGYNYDFRWAQFSTFKDMFSDKDFLFHLFIIPFLYLSDNIITAGKYAIIFYNLLFIIAYLIILRRYIPLYFASLFLLFPLASITFSIYFTYLRPATLANIFTIIGIYLLINKKWVKLSVLALFYPLAHISFFTLVIFALLCETIRYVAKKEFFFRNIYVVIIATILGCFLHPNYPNNYLSIHLNGILVPFYTLTGVKLDFGGEFNTLPTKMVLMQNIMLFLIFNAIIWIKFLTKTKVSFSTLVWWGCTSFYLVLAFIGNRYWYTTNVLFFIFFASFLKDWRGEKKWTISIPFVLCICIFVAVFSFRLKTLGEHSKERTSMNIHYEKVARWMNKNIPAGQTIYHAYWSDSPAFICLNPKNNYMVVLDPIYMFYRYPKEYIIYQDLRKGKVSNPQEAFRKLFRTDYGYTRNNNSLYLQIKEDSQNFKILYEDDLGIVFQVLPDGDRAT